MDDFENEPLTIPLLGYCLLAYIISGFLWAFIFLASWETLLSAIITLFLFAIYKPLCVILWRCELDQTTKDLFKEA